MPTRPLPDNDPYDLRLPIPWIPQLEPPVGSPDVCETIFDALSGPIRFVTTFYASHDPHQRPLNELQTWSDLLDRASALALDTLNLLHEFGKAPRTWHAGYEIYSAVRRVQGILG